MCLNSKSTMFQPKNAESCSYRFDGYIWAELNLVFYSFYYAFGVSPSASKQKFIHIFNLISFLFIKNFYPYCNIIIVTINIYDCLVWLPITTNFSRTYTQTSTAIKFIFDVAIFKCEQISTNERKREDTKFNESLNNLRIWIRKWTKEIFDLEFHCEFMKSFCDLWPPSTAKWFHAFSMRSENIWRFMIRPILFMSFNGNVEEINCWTAIKCVLRTQRWKSNK